MSKVIYFGTAGCSGHVAIGIDADLTHDEYMKWCECDNDNWINELYQKPDKRTRYIRHHGLMYTAYSIPLSVDDRRLMSHTNLFWEGNHTEQEMANFIRSNNFLKKQFQLD